MDGNMDMDMDVDTPIEDFSWQNHPTVEAVSPAVGQPHTHTVIFLHGRGDDAINFKRGIVHNTWTNSEHRTAIEALPRTFRWVFPTAGLKPCAHGGFGSQWFDLWNHQNFADREGLQLPGLQDSVSRIRRLIAEEAAKLGGRYDRIVLMGISQGGATSVHTLLNLDVPEGAYQGERRLGAMVGVACRMPFPGRSLVDTRKLLGLDGLPNGNDVLRNTPIMLQHCAPDNTVPIQGGRQLRDTLLGFGASVQWLEYSEGQHWFKSPDGLDHLVIFLNKALGLPQS